MRLRWLAIALLGVFLLATLVISEDFFEPGGHEIVYSEPSISISPVNNLCPGDTVTLTYNDGGRATCGNDLDSAAITTLRLPNDDSNRGKVGIYNSGGGFVTSVGFGKEPSIYCGSWDANMGANKCAYAVGGSCSQTLSAPSSAGAYYVKFDWNVRGETEQCLEWRLKQLPQSFTVVGKSSSLSTSKATYFPGESVTATTSTSCSCTRNQFQMKMQKQDGTLVSSLGSGVHASSDSTAYGDTFYGSAPSEAGTYNVVLDSPDDGCDRYSSVNVCSNTKSITADKQRYRAGESISASTQVSCGCAKSAFSVKILAQNGNTLSTLVQNPGGATVISYSDPSATGVYSDSFAGYVPSASGQYLLKLDSTNDACDATTPVNVEVTKYPETCSPYSAVCTSSADCCNNVCDTNALQGIYYSVTIRAKGAYSSGYSGSVMPVIELWIRESPSQPWGKRATFTVTTSYADYTKQWGLGSEPLIREGSEVAVVYTNADPDNGRELYVDYIRVNGAYFQAENVRVTYHVGNWQADDRVVPGQEFLAQNGGLRFPVGNGVCIQCSSGLKQGYPTSEYGGGKCETACGAALVCDETTWGAYSGNQCCNQNCGGDTLSYSCFPAPGQQVGDNCYYGTATYTCANLGWSCNLLPSQTCGGWGYEHRGSTSCYDNGVSSGGNCYWGESCSASGYTAPQSASIDDGNSCTVDICSSSGVSHVTKILDGLSSSLASDCCSGLRDNSNGVCIRCNSNSVQTSPSNVYGGSLCDSSCGADIRCDEKAAGAASGNSCCTTSCNYLDITGSCPSPKTVSGVCYYNPNPSCTSTVNCNYGTATIDDGNACTIDACTASGVTHTSLATAGQSCSQNSQCCSGTCDTSSGVCVTCDANKKQTSPTPGYGGGLCEAACGSQLFCDEKDPTQDSACCRSDCSQIQNCRSGGCYYNSATDNRCYIERESPACTACGCTWCSGASSDTDTDATHPSGDNPNTAGTCTDDITPLNRNTKLGYDTNCQGTPCQYSTSPDACLTQSTLREYYSSGSSCLSRDVNCQDQEANYCGSGSNLNKIMRNEWQCSSGADGGYCNDGAVDALVDDCGAKSGWYCNGLSINTREYRQYSCTAGPACTYTVTSSDDCLDKASVDNDGGDAPFVSGACTDYIACGGSPGSATCLFGNVPDACQSSANLLETYPLSADCLGKTYNCLLWGQSCSDLDGIAGVTTPIATTGQDSTGCAANKCRQQAFSQRDVCVSSTLTEYGCPANPSAQDQPYISQNYDCLTYGQTCTDSDAGSPDVKKVTGTVAGTDAQGCNQGANGGNCVQNGYSVTDVCADANFLTEYACNANPIAQNSPYTSSSNDCRAYDTQATGDNDDSPGTTGICSNGDIGSCGAGKCNVNTAHTAFAEGCAGACGTGVDSCSYSEYYMADSNGAFASEACVLKTYDSDDAAVANHNPCTACGQVWLASGQRWTDSQGQPVGSNPGEYTAFGAAGCCGDDSTEIANPKRGIGATSPETACCTSGNSCTHNGKCYQDLDTYTSAKGLQRKDVISQVDKDRVYQDTNGDGFLEVCEANFHPGRWVTPTGAVSGRVTDAGGNSISGAEVKILGTKNRTLTDAAGNYLIKGVNASSLSLKYDMISSRAPFSPSTKKDVLIPDFDTSIVNFVLGYGPTLCEGDCTFSNDEMCHSECQGTNGCLFYDQAAIAACDGLHTGFTRPYSYLESGELEYELRCCTGKPKEPVRIKATVKINSPSVARITKTVYYEGRLVKMIIDVFE
ncbi:carboxypeptidase regulatory-like domain-containing protein [Candidatus Woesearchaeota archaeon]|nr:carboxypeptidase regulatory-like domain-containing protein [Candidatus Woesearchaeota archaeon]